MGFYKINQHYLSYFPVKYINIVIKKKILHLLLENVKYYYSLEFTVFLLLIL